MGKLLFLLFGGVKLGKLLLTGGTMLLSVFAYGLVFGWRYAAGFVLLIFVHEIGHYVAARQRGLAVGAPTFIPFVGAWIALKDQPHDAETEAHVGLGGPLLGTIGAMVCYFVGRNEHSHLWLALAYAGFFINLFNMIPLSPFDGGRITAVLGPRIWLLGVPILVAMFLYRPGPLLILMALLAAPQVMKALRHDPNAAENVAYYGVDGIVRLQYVAYYLGLAAYLLYMTGHTHVLLQGLL